MSLRTQSRPILYGKAKFQVAVFTEGQCLCCGTKFSRRRPGARDHLIPRRWCLVMNWEPERPENIVKLCKSCNSRKVRCENLLFGRGMVLGFLTELNILSDVLARMARDMFRTYGWHFAGE